MNLLVFNLKMDADDAVLGFTTDWVNGLAKHCERVVVLTMTMGRLAVAPNVEVFSVGREKGFSEPRRAFEFYRLLSDILARTKIDACFAHMMPLFAVMGWPVLRARKLRTVLWYAHGHISPLVRLAARLVDRVVASSRSGFPMRSGKLEIIGQGIDIERFCPQPTAERVESDFILLTVGRISRVKRLDLLLRALRELPERLADGKIVRARFVGNPITSADREYARDLERLAEELAVRNRVEFIPAEPFDRVHAVYRAADLFVNSSETNSVDKTVLEAMSSGIFVVTSNVAFHEVIGHELADLCLVPGNDPQGLARAIARILQLPADARRAVGMALRAIVVRDHSIRALCARLIVQIEQVRSATDSNVPNLAKR